MKLIRHFLVATLVTALFFSSLTQHVFALDNASTNPVPSDVIAQQAATDPSKDIPIQEVVEKREANVKHFLTDNFRYVAMVYPVVVHYKENGSWKEIDNHLQSTVDEAKNDVVENVANDVKVRFAKNTQSGKLVSIQLGTYGLSWSFEGIAKKAVQVIQPSDMKDKDVTTVENLTSSASYPDIFPGVDLEYVLRGEEVKENLLLKSKESQRSFTQVFNFTNLIPKSQEDGTILIVDEKGSIVFRFERPLMVDDKGVESQDIQSTLTQVNKTWQLTLIPSAKWLDAPERVYPITLDPTISTLISTAAIDDAHVTATLPNSNFYNSYILKTGFGGCIHRTYLKFALPTLTASDMVITASLAMSLANVTANSQNNYQVNAHKVLGSWTETGLTWNNKPAYNAKIEDYAIVGKSPNPQAYTWNITSIVKDWYTTGINNGLMLKDNFETSGYKEYYSADTSQTYLSYRPVIKITYVNNNGLESYWTYHSQDVGRAGVGYVNDYNGNLVFLHQDTVGTGNLMPISVNHVYNNNDRTKTISPLTGDFGVGWRLNVSQLVQHNTSTGLKSYIDEDGTIHYFKTTVDADGYYEDEAGPQYKLKLVSGNYELVDSSDRKYNFTLYNSSNNVNSYLLTRITDENGNFISFSYTGSRLDKVTDGVLRETTFTYAADGKLSKITDPAGRETTYIYSSGYLTEITYPDQRKSLYTYDITGLNAGNLLSVTDKENTLGGYRITYTYTSISYVFQPSRVTSINESNTSTSPVTSGKSFALTFGSNTTVIKDNVANTKEIYTFNNDGNTTNARDENDISTYYGYDLDPNVKNTMISASKPQKTVVNLLVNHSYETDASWTIGYDGTSTASIGYATTSKFLGNRTFYINKTNTANRHYFTQTITGLVKGKTYTFSGYIKTVGISTGTNVGAALAVYTQNAAGTWIQTQSKHLSGTQDWQRIEVTFTIPADSSSTNVMVRPMVEGATGAAFIDALQLETGPVSNAYNLIENPDFRYGTTSWSVSGDTTVITTADPLHPVSSDNNVMRINGEVGVNKQFYQSLNLSGVAGDSYVLGGWAKSDSVPLSGSRLVALYIRFDYMTLNDYGYFKAVFNVDSTEWQYLSFRAKAERQYKAIYVIAVYSYNANAGMFDSLALHKENFDKKYTYDDQGNITTITDLDNQVTTYAYINGELTSITDPEGNITTIENTNGEISQITTPDNVVTTFTSALNGNVTSTRTGSDSLFTTTSTTYSSNGNYMASQTDSEGHVVQTVYDSDKGTLSSYTDANGHETTYSYDPATDALLSVSSTVGTSTATNTYGYTNDRLSSITHNGFNYGFIYDPLGNLISINVGSQVLVTNGYLARTNKLLQTQYANSQTVSYDYDSADRISAIRYNGTIKFKYTYDARGNLTISEDIANSVTLRYSYDSSDRLVGVSDSNGNRYSYDYDQNSNVGVFRETIGTKSFTTSYTSEDGKPKSVTANNGSSTTNGYDALGRLLTKTLATGSTTRSTSYTYLTGLQGSTTDRIGSITNNGAAITYEYDANGNITQITDSAKNFGYVYNELNELVRENNGRENATYVYNYDLGGNILSKVTYPYTVGALGSSISTVNYTYGDSNWKDKLTSYGTLPITYDAIGNPLTYNGSTYTWTMGRQLSTIDKTGFDIDYKYNDAGIRIQKKVNTVTTNYHLVGDKVTYESDGTHAIYYTYDAQDKLVSMNLTEAGVATEYYYIRNAQDDIIGLLDGNGNQVVSYTYSAWGEAFAPTGTLKDTIGALNPYRYRGYRYDTETGLYYLQSRYYNPQWGRFINADDLSILGVDQGSLIQNNLFVYCLNNPITNIDPQGKWVQAVIGALIGVVIASVTYWLEYKLGMRDWNWLHYYGHIALAAVLGAIGGYVRYWAKFANLSQYAAKLNISQPLLKNIITWGSRGITFAINAIAKSFTRRPGESWVIACKRWFGW